jgi:hypothetical protein
VAPFLALGHGIGRATKSRILNTVPAAAVILSEAKDLNWSTPPHEHRAARKEQVVVAGLQTRAFLLCSDGFMPPHT